MRLVAIRHAITEFNQRELINGTIDESLSEEGLAQIPHIIDGLKQYTFTIVYSSNLKRCVQTATPIAHYHKVPLKKDHRISEVDLGSFNGQGWDSTIPYFGANSSGVLSSCEYDFKPFGGESSNETRRRVAAFLQDIKRHPAETPLVVTHGGILRWFHYLINGEKVGRIPHLGVHEFELR